MAIVAARDELRCLSGRLINLPGHFYGLLLPRSSLGGNNERALTKTPRAEGRGRDGALARNEMDLAGRKSLRVLLPLESESATVSPVYQRAFRSAGVYEHARRLCTRSIIVC
jgi:hypothetical protein